MNYRLCLILCVLIPLPSMAATKYVSDQLRITLRTGQGNQFEIIKTLESGAKLEILEETDTGYTQVRLPDGMEGWVRTQYLVDEPIAADKLANAENKLARTQEKLNKAEEELKTLRKENNQLGANLGKLKSEHTAASKELETLNQLASRPKQLAQENTELRKQFEQISDELNLTKQENQVLKDRSKRNWFLAGAGVVILGMLIGLIIPKLRFQKKSGWDY
jgi:SH3 domain protein